MAWEAMFPLPSTEHRIMYINYLQFFCLGNMPLLHDEACYVVLIFFFDNVISNFGRESLFSAQNFSLSARVCLSWFSSDISVCFQVSGAPWVPNSYSEINQ